MEEFFKLAEKHGLGIIALVAIVYTGARFFRKSLWPAWMAQMERAEKRLDDCTAAFLGELKEMRRHDGERTAELTQLIGIRADRIEDKIDKLK